MLIIGDAADATKLVGKYDYVNLYSADCDHPCPPDIASHWDGSHKRFITFGGNSECSIIDFEKYTRDFANPAILRRWLQERADRASPRHAWIYSDLSNAPTAAHWARGLSFRWWIATLDGVKRSQAQLSDLMLAWGCPAEYAKPELIEANQWRTIDDTDESFGFDWR